MSSFALAKTPVAHGTIKQEDPNYQFKTQAGIIPKWQHEKKKELLLLLSLAAAVNFRGETGVRKGCIYTCI